MSRVACVDVGSTYTKAALVDVDTGELVATAEHPTTVDTDVLHGLDAALAALQSTVDTVYACSSAGGGLRLAVVGYERLVTAEAGHRVGLTAGARVVHTSAGPLDSPGVRELRAARPDVVLLVGGTDGGDAETLLHNARRLAGTRLRKPVVVAGNADATPEALGTLAAAGVPATATANVLPRIGDLRPGPARAAIREVFLRHVIGGKGLSRGTRFASLVRAATPDAVLTGVELLAEQAGDVLVVDVGGATTDVYSVLEPDGGNTAVAGTAWHGRTVEGDLGVRWGAPGVVSAARAERLPADDALVVAAARRAADPGFLPADDAERDAEVALAALAATVAVRRHARGARDLAAVRLVVMSGGVLRHATPAGRDRVLDAVLGDLAGGWALPRSPRRAADLRYVLAAAGLLAGPHPRAAAAVVGRAFGQLP